MEHKPTDIFSTFSSSSGNTVSLASFLAATAASASGSPLPASFAGVDAPLNSALVNSSFSTTGSVAEATERCVACPCLRATKNNNRITTTPASASACNAPCGPSKCAVNNAVTSVRIGRILLNISMFCSKPIYPVVERLPSSPPPDRFRWGQVVKTPHCRQVPTIKLFRAI